MTFGERVRDLERSFRTLAERDGSVYLQNFMPAAPVDYVFIGMEPSLGAWASSPEKARAKIAAGFRNFMWSLEDFILHMSARQYLCEPGQTYYVTDISKGAMSVKKANRDRAGRYKRWFDLLKQEIELVAKPNATVIPVGQAVAKNLRALGFSRALDPILHYSGQASRARRAAIVGHEEAFRAFTSSVTLDTIVTAASVTLRENDIPPSLIDSTLARIGRAQLTESRMCLLFAYKLAFEAIRCPVPRERAG